MNDKLRECGCGHMPIISHKGYSNTRLHWISCECGMKTGYFIGEDEMIRVWNRCVNTRHQPKHETVCNDDVLLQEIQSLREQIKILANITYSYNPDFPLGDYLHNLSTEDY